jgi:hypothetical protein
LDLSLLYMHSMSLGPSANIVQVRSMLSRTGHLSEFRCMSAAFEQQISLVLRKSFGFKESEKVCIERSCIPFQDIIPESWRVFIGLNLDLSKLYPEEE